MSFRRRQRWLRRLALGLALVTAASVGRASIAAAAVDESTSGRVGAGDPYLTDVFVRPDDAAARFSHSDVPSQPVLASGDKWTFEGGDALILAVGTFVLVLGLGLALGYLRRPRLAGF